MRNADRVPQTHRWKVRLPGLLLLLVTTVVAGCARQEASDGASPEPSEALPSEPITQPTSGVPTSSPPPSPTTQAPGSLDLREANVVAVAFEVLGENRYRFDVTLWHDDDAEAPDFADWWQVEDLEGNLLGRRVLLHSHSSQPFTRSETISLPEGLTQVLVRGHDMQHGFGGQAMLVDLQSGETKPVPDAEVDTP